MTPILQLLGRILMSAIFIASGFGKLQNIAGTEGYIASHGLPMPTLAAWVAVAIELGVGLALLTGLFSRAAGAVLAVWCVVTALIFHNNLAEMPQMIQFMKNLAMAGGLLYVAAVGGGALSLDTLLQRNMLTARATRGDNRTAL